MKGELCAPGSSNRQGVFEVTYKSFVRCLVQCTMVLYVSVMGKRLNVSEARRQLFDLFEEVTSNRRARIVIGHRDSDQEAVLLSRVEVERLERLARSGRRSEFSLVGSAVLNVDAEDVLKRVRAEQDLLHEEKLASLRTKG